jgi:hypothetical protein
VLLAVSVLLVISPAAVPSSPIALSIVDIIIL